MAGGGLLNNISNGTVGTQTGFDNTPNAGNQLLNNAVSNIAGILSTKPTAKFMSGARCILKLNGEVFGFAFGISWNIRTDNIEINTIDDYLPHELAPQRIHVDGTLSCLHIPGQGPSALLLQADVLSFLFHKYICIEVRDVQTDQLLFQTNQAVITSRAEELRVDDLANVTLQWKAIGWLDEAKVNDKLTGIDSSSAQVEAEANAASIQNATKAQVATLYADAEAKLSAAAEAFKKAFTPPVPAINSQLPGILTSNIGGGGG